MKQDDYIDDFIRKEKLEKPNLFLVDEIMAKLETEVKPYGIRKFVPIWQKIAVAASIAFVIYAGYKLGSIGIGTGINENNNILNINDIQMENLNIYITSNYE